MSAILANLQSSPSVLPLLALCIVGGLNRVTRGLLLPGFYGYQLERAPEHWINPLIDFGVAFLLVATTTRPYAAGACLALHGLGIGMRLEQGKGVVKDLGLCLLPLLALLGSLPVWHA
jgi:hypothetical protein